MFPRLPLELSPSVGLLPSKCFHLKHDVSEVLFSPLGNLLKNKTLLFRPPGWFSLHFAPMRRNKYDVLPPVTSRRQQNHLKNVILNKKTCTMNRMVIHSPPIKLIQRRYTSYKLTNQRETGIAYVRFSSVFDVSKLIWLSKLQHNT
jgi:hypothetical protein